MTKPLVIDLYYQDDVTSFQAIKDAGILGVIHKASEGMTFTDKLYARRRESFTAFGLKWGAYHFFHGSAVGSDPVAEADHFLEVSDPDKDTLVALDWEDVSHHGAPSAASARAFLERIEDKLGRRAVIYSGNVAKEQLTPGTILDGFWTPYRLWLAQYGSKWTVPKPWTYPWLWQNNGDGYGPGPQRISGVTDLCDNSCIVDPMTTDRLLSEWALQENADV